MAVNVSAKPDGNAERLVGAPFSRLFTPNDYHAHIRNFDIVCDKKGDIYVANFEGLLHFDHARWRVYHTPSTLRITDIMALDDNSIVALDFTNQPYILKDGRLQKYSGHNFRQQAGQSTVREAKDPYGGTWAITEDGILFTATNSPVSFINDDTELQGDVRSLLSVPGYLYVGTLKGLWRISTSATPNSITAVNIPYFHGTAQNSENSTSAVWHLAALGPKTILAATASGVFAITEQAKGVSVRRISSKNTLTLAAEDAQRGSFFAGETDGVYHYQSLADSSPELICKVNNPNKIIVSKEPRLWVGSIYGQVLAATRDKNTGKYNFKLMAGTKDSEVASTGTIIQQDDDIYIDCPNKTYVWDCRNRRLTEQSLIFNDAEQYYTHFTYTSPDGISFASEANGKGLYAFSGRQEMLDYSAYTWCTEQENVQAMAMTRDYIALGGNFGVWSIQRDSVRLRETRPRLLLRHCTLKDNDLSFSFSTDHQELPGQTLYSYRLAGKAWSERSLNSCIQLPNMPYGRSVIQMKCMDMYGIESDILEQTVYVPFPRYLKWYAILAYCALSILAVYYIIRWRTLRIKRENIKLEHIVQQRTRQLQETQKLLIRQEKIQMVAKLTQGLIDRILNPMNYILNFTKLNQQLQKDLKLNIEDERQSIPEDIYNDCLDLDSMLQENLSKIEQHSTATTRILKAMETLIHEQTISKARTDLNALLWQCLKLAQTYYADNISRQSISVSLQLPDTKVYADIDADKISRSIMSVIANSFYAIDKKYQRAPFLPEITIQLEALPSAGVRITITDNGTGIDDAIKDKVFDPFFTTKTTAEAAGVGLYLTREIIHGHQGEIALETEKDKFTKITITFNA